MLWRKHDLLSSFFLTKNVTKSTAYRLKPQSDCAALKSNKMWLSPQPTDW